MSQTFVHLHVHTEYSLVDSTVRIPALMQSCAEERMPAVALTDKNNLFGMVKFYSKAVAAGVKPLIGADIRIIDDGDPDRPYTLILLCQNNDGYRNLSRLLTRAFVEERYRGDAFVRRHWLTAEACEGLIALSGGIHGDVGRALALDHPDDARERLQSWLGVFGNRFYLELIRTGRPGEENCVQGSLRLAGELRVPVVASNDVRFIAADDFNAHEARVCIHEGRNLADADRPRHYSPQQYLRSAEEMAALFADVPQALENSVEIAKRCNLDLRLGNSVLPAFPVPAGQTEAEFLESEARRGLDARLAARAEAGSGSESTPAAPYLARLEKELEV
ncbi:MAG: PHP domain-containing protein, partial [Woeseiaceae bacterium]|nr:PHP domain-containing protein [Woeseiaceae bacterium]